MVTLKDTGVWIIAKDMYECNILPYHNWTHILDGLAWMRANVDDPSKLLQVAWLYHDIVYDDKPEKEKRSADMFDRVIGHAFSADERARVRELIMYTSHHDLSNVGDDAEGVAIIKADLHPLQDPLLALRNAVNINYESQHLYGIDMYDAAQGSVDFMRKFTGTMSNNYRLSDDPFWLDIAYGCHVTKGAMVDVAGARP